MEWRSGLDICVEYIKLELGAFEQMTWLVHSLPCVARVHMRFWTSSERGTDNLALSVDTK